MTTLIEHLLVLLGSNTLAADVSLLTAADARAAKLPREHGILYSKAVQQAVEELTTSASTGESDATRAAYYLGLQVGWRIAQRLR